MRCKYSLGAKLKGVLGSVYGTAVAQRHVEKLWMSREENRWYYCRLSPQLWGEEVLGGALGNGPITGKER